jgi:transposase
MDHEQVNELRVIVGISFKMRSERLDDVPFILEIMDKLQVDRLIDRYARTDVRQKNLTNGELAIVWLAYVLSMSDHCKVGLEEWAALRTHMLSTFLGKTIRAVDFCDDRMGRLFSRISQDVAWELIEQDLWKATIEVHELPAQKIRIDATTCTGYHCIDENGIMQLGHSKQHRPDLPQLKIMAGAIEGFGHIIATDVVPGNKADDPLYVPLIQRIRKIIKKKGVLYTGDCKMAALKTRADIVANQDFYLIPLPMTGDTPIEMNKWIQEAADKKVSLESVTLIKQKKSAEELAQGYEFTRTQSYDKQKWEERVLIIRSNAFHKTQSLALDQRLETACQDIPKLTPPPGKGRRQIITEQALITALSNLQKRLSVEGMLEVSWEKIETSIEKYKGRGRGSPKRERVAKNKVRYKITKVLRNEDVITKSKYALGWRAYVTNAKSELLSLKQSVMHYRSGYKSIERQFDLLKNKPLGLSPLYVRKNNQLIGLTRLLSIALRAMTLIEMVLQTALQNHQQVIVGLLRGQPKRKTTVPSGQSILSALFRAEITLHELKIEGEKTAFYEVTKLPDHLKCVFKHLNVSTSMYEAERYKNLCCC